MPLSERVVQQYNYDKAVVDWLGNIEHRGKPVRRVFATPERWRALVARRIEEEKGLPEGSVSLSTIPLPVISISLIGLAFIPERFHKVKLRRTHITGADTREQKYLGYWHPYPLRRTYQFDFWAKDIATLNHLTEQLLMQFEHNVTYLTVDHPYLLGVREVLTRLRGVGVDTSGLQSQEGQRSLRRTFTVDVDGWLAYPPEEVGIVLKVTTEILESDDLETARSTLGVVTVDETSPLVSERPF